MHALAAAHELRLDAVIDQLLQDFLQVCPDDYSSQFVSECLPLLFNIFRYSKVIEMLLGFCFGRLFAKKISSTARMYNFTSGRHICHMFWMGIDQSDQGTRTATGQWFENRSKVCK